MFIFFLNDFIIPHELNDLKMSRALERFSHHGQILADTLIHFSLDIVNIIANYAFYGLVNKKTQNRVLDTIYLSTIGLYGGANIQDILIDDDEEKHIWILNSNYIYPIQPVKRILRGSKEFFVDEGAVWYAVNGMTCSNLGNIYIYRYDSYICPCPKKAYSSRIFIDNEHQKRVIKKLVAYNQIVVACFHEAENKIGFQVFDSFGKKCLAFNYGNHMTPPSSLAIYEEKLYVGDTSKRAIHVFDTTNGHLIQTIRPNVGKVIGPSDLVCDSMGNLFAIFGDRVYILTKDGDAIIDFSWSNVCILRFDCENKMYIVTPTAIAVCTFVLNE